MFRQRPLPPGRPRAYSVKEHNPKIPQNVYLTCGDNLLEIQAEAIRKTSQLDIPEGAWKHVISWIADLRSALVARSAGRESIFFLDCNPSFAIFTQLALAASQHVVVPFTADDSSRRGIENVYSLLYGVGGKDYSIYLKLSFAARAREEGVTVPTLHTFVSNRVTKYGGHPSRAFQAVISTIKTRTDELFANKRTAFSNSVETPSSGFVTVPDYHGACIVASTNGTPLHGLRPGPNTVHEEPVQLNAGPLDDYKDQLALLVGRL